MDFVSKMVDMIIQAASPELRKILNKWILDFETKAAETPNPWDDKLAAILKAILYREE